MALTERDNGNRIAHPANEQLEVSLPENPTTGFRWGFVDLDPSVQIAEDTYDPEEIPTPGAAARRRFRLAFPHPGEYQIALRLWREWEGDASTTDRYSITVDAADGV